MITVFHTSLLGQNNSNSGTFALPWWAFPIILSMPFLIFCCVYIWDKIRWRVNRLYYRVRYGKHDIPIRGLGDNWSESSERSYLGDSSSDSGRRVRNHRRTNLSVSHEQLDSKQARRRRSNCEGNAHGESSDRRDA